MYVRPVKRAGTEIPLDLSRRDSSLMLERPLASLFFKNDGGPPSHYINGGGALVYPCSSCFYQGSPCPLHAPKKVPEPPPHAPANGILLQSSGSEPDLVAPPCLEAVPPEGPPSISPALSPPQLTAAVPPLQVALKVAMHKLEELDTPPPRKKKRKKREIEEVEEEPIEEEEKAPRLKSVSKENQNHHYRTRVTTKRRLCQKFVYKRYNKNAAYEEELIKEARHLSELRARKRLRRRKLERLQQQQQNCSEMPEDAEDGDDEATPKQPNPPVRRRRLHHRRSGLDMINQRKRKPVTPAVPRVRTVPRDLGGGDVKKVIVNKALGETVLHRAARQGHLGLVESCLRTGIGSVGARDNAGFTPLHEACGRRATDRTHLTIARCLLQHGADPNAASANGGIRPLHDAVENGHMEITRLLLSYGADPSLATYAGYTPLRLARSVAMGALLQAYMADCNGEPSPVWHFGGSSSCFDPDCSGFNVLDDLPSDAETMEEDGFVFEVSERPHLPSFRLQLPGHSLTSNCLRLSDVLEQLGEQREEFEAKHPEVAVWEVSRHVFEMGATCSQLLAEPLIDSLLNSAPTTGDTVALVALEGPLRELLDIQTLVLR